MGLAIISGTMHALEVAMGVPSIQLLNQCSALPIVLSLVLDHVCAKQICFHLCALQASQALPSAGTGALLLVPSLCEAHIGDILPAQVCVACGQWVTY